jgi:hypothetical protein
VACSCAPDGAVATAARPDEPRPKTTRSLLDAFTEGDVLDDEVAWASTGVPGSTPAKASVTVATSLRGETRTRTVAGTELPATLRQAASSVLDRVRWRISLAPEVHVTLAPRWVSTKVSRTSPVTVPAGTMVMAVPAFEDSKVDATPVCVMVMVVAAVDVSSCGAALTAMPTPRTPAVTATMVRQPRGSPGRPRRACPRGRRGRRGPASSLLPYWLKSPRGYGPGCADMSISLAPLMRLARNRRDQT